MWRRLNVSLLTGIEAVVNPAGGVSVEVYGYVFKRCKRIGRWACKAVVRHIVAERGALAIAVAAVATDGTTEGNSPGGSVVRANQAHLGRARGL